MLKWLAALLLLSAPAFAQPGMGPGAPPQSRSRPLFVNTTASSGIAFTQNIETILTPCSYTIPGGTLQKAGDSIAWWASGNFVGNTDLKTITARYSGSGVAGTAVSFGTGATASSGFWQAQGMITRITATSQRISTGGIVQNSGNTAFIAPNISAAAVDSVDAPLVITGKNANAAPANDTLICNTLIVNLVAGP